MKILLVVDGSSYSDIATSMVAALHLSSRSTVTVLTVVPEHAFLGEITLHKLRGNSARKEAERQKAQEILQKPVQALGTAKLKVESPARWGDPAEEILKACNESSASLIVMGAKGLTKLV